MRILAACLGALLLLPVSGWSQETNLVTHPRVPDAQDLARFNLKVAYQLALPVEGEKDGIVAIQLLDSQLLVQLRSGYAMVYDAENGALQWNARPGNAYPMVFTDATADDRYLILARDARLYGYNRPTGRLDWVYDLPAIPSSAPVSDGDRLYIDLGDRRLICYDLPARAQGPEKEGLFAIKERRETGPTKPAPGTEEQPRYVQGPRMVRIGAGVSPGNVAMQAAIGPPTNVTLSTVANRTPSIAVMERIVPPYELNSASQRQTTASLAPLPSVIPPYKLNSNVAGTPSLAMMNSMAHLADASMRIKPEPPLKSHWTYAPLRVVQPILVTSGPVIAAGTDRNITAFKRLNAIIVYEFHTSAYVIAPLGQYGDTAFIPTLDGSLYALDGLAGKLLWRFTADTALDRQPSVVGDDIFITTAQSQLYRINRKTGESGWRDPQKFLDRHVNDIQHFLAANDRFVYGLSTKYEIVILDRQRGIEVARLPMRGFTFGYENQTTGRIYLAANNGTLVCLRDLNVTKPIIYLHKEAPAATPETAPAAPIVKPKEDMPKDDKPKDEKPKDNKPKDDKP